MAKTKRTTKNETPVTVGFETIVERFTPRTCYGDPIYEEGCKPEVYSLRSLKNTAKALAFFRDEAEEGKWYTAKEIGVPSASLCLISKYLGNNGILQHKNETVTYGSKTYQNIDNPNDTITFVDRRDVFVYKCNCCTKVLDEMYRWLKAQIVGV